MTQAPPLSAGLSTRRVDISRADVSAVPRQYLDPPAAWNPTVGLFLAGFGLAGLTIWGWFVGQWPLPLLLLTGFLALHLEGTVIHDACHNAAHPSRFWNAFMGHGAALLLGFSFPVFTRVHLQHHAHVNDPKHDPDHIVSTFGPLWLIAPRCRKTRVARWIRRSGMARTSNCCWRFRRTARLACCRLGRTNFPTCLSP